VPITKEQNIKFLKQMTPEERQNGAPLMQMKLKMIEELTTFLQSKVEDAEKDKIAIADINFALRNGWLFKLLKKRGNAIKWKDWEKLE
jgi:3-hydroxymyristoyl/3-hydroxydecanoyl-(acyl carrier protein) dehydratase